MAHYDALTGLPNRAYFTEQVEADLERRRRIAASADDLAMLMIVDIDDFKHVNDTMGHLIGDRVLVETSERLSRVLGRDSLVARLGGDEFIVYRSGGVHSTSTIDRRPRRSSAASRRRSRSLGEVFSVNVSSASWPSRDRPTTISTR